MNGGCTTKSPPSAKIRWRQNWSDTAKSWRLPGARSFHQTHPHMAFEPAIERYRKLYAKLLRSYPKSYRERFAEGMEQTFNDLCRERAEAGDGLIGFVLWMFAETSTAIIRENGRSVVMQNKSMIHIA